jgi:branched-chain amino acid transport system substrate-binding protein
MTPFARWALAAALSAAVSVVPTVSPLAADDRTVTIPVIVPLTGPGAEYGAGDKLAVLMAFDEVNAHGGIDGYKLKADIYDDGSVATQSAGIMHGLVANSLAILGPNLSTTCKAAFPIANASGVVAISSSISDASILAQNRPWTFNVFLPGNTVEKAAADKFVAMKKPKTVVAIVDRDEIASSAQATFLLDALQGDGVKLVRRIDVSEQQATYGSEADAAKALKPDMLVVSAYPDPSGAIVKALRGAGMNQPILFTITSITPDSLRIGGSAMTNGWAMVEAWPGIGNARKRTFDENFEKLSKGLVPEPTAPYMYDTAMLLAAGLKSSGVLKSNAPLDQRRTMLRDALAHQHVAGVTGDWNMTPSGLRTGTPLWLAIQDGKVVETRD